MMKPTSRYARTRNIFLILFLISSCLGISLSLLQFMRFNSGGPNSSNPDLVAIGSVVAMGTSCVTAIVTFIGFVSTTILVWRKEARDKTVGELERRHRELEIEKDQLELERLRAEQKAQGKKQRAKGAD